MARAVVIAVVGGSIVGEDVKRQAYEVGRELASRGAIVINGGLGGVMEGASRGAKEAGGLVIGILPGVDRRDGNEHLTVGIATGMGYGRNTIVSIACDAMVAVDGSYGTLSEISQALNHGRPVVSLDSWDLPSAGDVKEGLFHSAATPAEAARLAIDLAKARR
jgi:uncharacterized protein (TIGR00725 family)